VDSYQLAVLTEQLFNQSVSSFCIVLVYIGLPKRWKCNSQRDKTGDLR